MENSDDDNVSSEEQTRPCELSPCDIKSESGYSTNSICSISDQTGVVGVTMAALELVNGSPVTNTPAKQSNEMMYDHIGPDQHYGQDNAESVISSFLSENRSYQDYNSDRMDSASFTSLLNVKPLTDMEYPPTDLCRPVDFSIIVHKEINANDPTTQFNYADNVVHTHDVQLADSQHDDYYDRDKSAIHASVIVKTPRSSHSDTDTSSYSPSQDEPSIIPVKHKKRNYIKGSDSCIDESDDNIVRQKDNTCKPRPHLLPPCKVCGVQATGFHYGVNTCEACKGFFRRSIIRKQPYTCANNPVKCAISPGKRKTCPSCRYKKCLESGMSVEGIKIGRYTYAKRTQDILELNTTSTVPITPPTPNDESYDEHFNTRVPEPELVPELDLVADNTHSLIEFINVIVQANETKYPEYLKSTTMVEQIQEKVKEQHASGEIPISINQVPMDHFLSVLSSTGVQLDNRIQVLQQWVVLLEEGLKNVVSFAKDIPGFRDLKLSDQMGLIKHSICEVWLISRHMAFHTDFDFYTTQTGMTLDVVKTMGETFGSNLLKITRALRELELTIPETIMLKAYVIFFTDRCEIDEWEKVTLIRDRLEQALLHLLSQRGANTSHHIGKLSAILTELRMTTELYQEYTKKMQILSTTTGVMDLPPLLQEVINVT